MSGKTMLVADPDGHLVECEILSSHTKESIFQKSIPVLPPLAAAFFAFLNLVPGKSCSENIHSFFHLTRSRDFSWGLDSDLWRKIIIWNKSWSMVCHDLDYVIYVYLPGLTCGTWDSFLASCDLIGHCWLVLEYYVSCLLIGQAITNIFLGMEHILSRRPMKLKKKGGERKQYLKENVEEILFCSALVFYVL